MCFTNILESFIMPKGSPNRLLIDFYNQLHAVGTTNRLLCFLIKTLDATILGCPGQLMGIT